MTWKSEDIMSSDIIVRRAKVEVTTFSSELPLCSCQSTIKYGYRLIRGGDDHTPSMHDVFTVAQNLHK